MPNVMRRAQSVSWLLFLLVLLGQGNPLVSGKQRGLDTFPPEVRNLITTARTVGRDGEPYQFVAAVPDSFPTELLPRVAQVVAVGIASSFTTVVLRFPQGSSFDEARYVWDLEGAGWQRSTALRAFGLDLPTVPSVGVCKGTVFAEVLPPDTTALARVSVRTEQGRSCAGPRFRPASDVPLRMIRLPGNFEVLRSSTSGAAAAEEVSFEARVTGRAEPRQLVDLIVKQLATVGWIEGGRAQGSSTVSVVRLLGNSKSGNQLMGILTVALMPGSLSFDVSLRVVR